MKFPQWQRLAGLVLMMAAGGCGPSASPNESNLVGPPVDPATVPQGRDEMVLRQKQKIAEFQKSPAPRGR
jgi:hypothetical protein